MAKIALQKDKNESQNGPSQFFFQEAKNSWVLFHPLQISSAGLGYSRSPPTLIGGDAAASAFQGQSLPQNELKG